MPAPILKPENPSELPLPTEHQPESIGEMPALDTQPLKLVTTPPSGEQRMTGEMWIDYFCEKILKGII